MPQLFESLFVDTVKMKFRGFNITLPTMVTTGTPTASIGQFLIQGRLASTANIQSSQLAVGSVPSVLSAFKLGGSAPAAPTRPTGTPQSVPPALFRAASNDKEDVDFQTQVNTEYVNYITAICHAIVGAHDNWRYTAFFKGVKIMGPIAMGGSISGPLLSVNLSMYGPQQGLWGNASAYTRAIADGLASCWREWEQSVRVPNLPWYPSFIAIPTANAPPTQNIPSPIAALVWSSASLAPDTIKSTISRKLSQPGPYSDELFQSIAAGFAAVVALWFPLQMVTKVFGQGPVPAFSPPYVPVGPVLGGSIIEASPHFAA